MCETRENVNVVYPMFIVYVLLGAFWYPVLVKMALEFCMINYAYNLLVGYSDNAFPKSQT